MATKTDWITYAANIAGDWSLCANCQPDTAAKKLFRQYQFYRLQLGLAVALTPVDDTEVAQLVPSFFTYHVNGLAGEYAVWGAAFPPSVDVHLIAQLGMIQSNPQVLLTPTDANVVLTIGAVFDWIKLCATTLLAQPPPGGAEVASMMVCPFNGTGAPGFRTAVDVHFIDG